MNGTNVRALSNLYMRQYKSASQIEYQNYALYDIMTFCIAKLCFIGEYKFNDVNFEILCGRFYTQRSE